MEAKKVDATTDELLNPSSRHWTRVRREVLQMEGTPVQMQPSRYIRAKWSDKPTGTVRALTVRSAHNGRQIFFRLEWRDDKADDSHDGDSFPDAAGVMFPLNGDAPVQTMGSPDAPVNAWFWRADDETPRNIVASGVGTVEEAEGVRLIGQSSWKNGVWRVVVGRSLRTRSGNEAVRFERRRPTKVAFAVWEGGEGERGGIKSFSNGWEELTLGA